MKVLKKITGKTILDQIRNDEIRYICQVEDINTWARHKIKWNGHIDRTAECQVVRIARDKVPSGRRSVG